MSTDHTHSFAIWHRIDRAPIGPAPAHTHVIVLTCECGAFDVFPPENFALCTRAFQVTLSVLMRERGYARLDVLDAARQSVASGGTHECDEWRTHRGQCALCDREI